MINILKNTAAASMVLVVAACNSEAPQSTAPEKIEAVPKVYQSPGKTSAPIEMQYTVLTENPQPGEEVSVKVTFQSPVPAALNVKLTAAKNLTWINAEKNFAVQSNKAGDRDALPLFKVMAPEAGVYYIKLIASVEQDGQVMSRPFTIPVRVGNGQRQLNQDKKVIVDDKGQRVLVQKSSQKEKQSKDDN